MHGNLGNEPGRVNACVGAMLPRTRAGGSAEATTVQASPTAIRVPRQQGLTRPEYRAIIAGQARYGLHFFFNRGSVGQRLPGGPECHASLLCVGNRPTILCRIEQRDSEILGPADYGKLSILRLRREKAPETSGGRATTDTLIALVEGTWDSRSCKLSGFAARIRAAILRQLPATIRRIIPSGLVST